MFQKAEGMTARLVVLLQPDSRCNTSALPTACSRIYQMGPYVDWGVGYMEILTLPAPGKSRAVCQYYAEKYEPITDAIEKGAKTGKS